MRSPDGKSQRGDDGGKGIGSSCNDEEKEYGSTMFTGDEVERRRHRRWRRDKRCCMQDEMVGVMLLVSS